MESKSAIRARLRSEANARKANQSAQVEQLNAAIEKRIADYDYCEARSISGEPSEKNRIHRASPNTWTTQVALVDGHVKSLGSRRVMGYTRKNGIGSIMPNTVKVTRNGKTEVVPVSQFRRPRVERQTAKVVTVTNTPEVLRMAATVGYIGNVE